MATTKLFTCRNVRYRILKKMLWVG